MRLLVADDAALIRAGIIGLLERAGHQVVAEAADAPELVAQCRRLAGEEGLPDVVITDVRMPPSMTDDGLRAAYVAVVIVTLAPGPYTAQVTSANGTTGVALVEIYEMP